MATSKKLFISYGSRDKQFAQRLRTDLSYYGIEVWLDDAELSLGDSLTDRITSAIEHIDYVAIVVSSHSIHSDWVRMELLIARENGKIIVPILLENVEIPSDIKSDIQDRVYADFTSQDMYARTFQRFLRLLDYKLEFKAKLSIFSDSIALGWENSSWDCEFDEKSTHYVHSGEYSIRAKLRGLGGLAFSFCSGVNTKYYKKLEFYINGGDVGGQRLKVFVNDKPGNGVRNPVSLDPLVPKEWMHVRIPLNDLGAEDIAIIKINISDVSGKSTSDFYIDGLSLVV